MTADELGCRVYHNVRPMLQRTYQVRGTKGVVDHEGDTVPVSNFRHSLQVNQVGIRIAQALHKEGFGPGTDGCLKIGCGRRVDKGCRHAIRREGVCQQVVRSSVDGLRRHQMIAGRRQPLQSVCDGGRTGRDSQRCYSSFQGCHPLFEHILGGVGQPSVDVAGILQPEASCRMGGITEYIRGGLIDGDGPCAGCRVGLLLPHMKL